MRIERLLPILRMFDEAKAREFYIDYLGARIAFEHRVSDDAPLYMGISLLGIELHLSEHHGDAAPGSAIRLELDDVTAYHAVLDAKSYRYARPGLTEQPWGFTELIVTDPFHNRLVFCTSHERLRQTDSDVDVPTD